MSVLYTNYKLNRIRKKTKKRIDILTLKKLNNKCGNIWQFRKNLCCAALWEES